MKKNLLLSIFTLALAMFVSQPALADNEGVTINPAEGEVTSLSSFTLTFDNVFLIGYQDDQTVAPIYLINDATNDSTLATINPGEESNQAVITLPEEITTAGNYTLSIPEGKFQDAFEQTNQPAFQFHYTIPGAITNEGVTINPAEGEVTSLSSFTLTFDNVFLIGYQDDQAVEPIVLINDETNDSTRLTIDPGEESNQAVISLPATITAAGSYTLSIAKGKFQDAFEMSDMPAYEFHYTIAGDAPTSIDRVATGSANTYVISRYNAAGQLISAPQRGLNIIKMSDGRTVKTIVK